MAKFSHRNGETDVPTIEGIFAACASDGYEKTVMVCDGSGYYQLPGDPRWHDLTFLADRGIRFWGPWEPWAEDATNIDEGVDNGS